MKKQLSNLKHIGDKLPGGWVKVRSELERLQKEEEKNHISFSTFRSVCEAVGIEKEEDQLALSGYLHDLGILLHYQQDEALFDRIFLNPQWVSNAVYTILSEKQLIEDGLFSKKRVFERWGEQYTREEKNAFLLLMQKEAFELVRVHLKALESEGISIDLWDDSRIKPGKRWREEIQTAIAETKVAVLMISADFLASDFIRNNELPPLLEAAEKEGATVLPLILRPCRFQQNKIISQYKSVNDPKEPLSGLSEHDQETILVALTNSIAEKMEE